MSAAGAASASAVGSCGPGRCSESPRSVWLPRKGSQAKRPRLVWSHKPLSMAVLRMHTLAKRTSPSSRPCHLPHQSMAYTEGVAATRLDTLCFIPAESQHLATPVVRSLSLYPSLKQSAEKQSSDLSRRIAAGAAAESDFGYSR